MFLKCIREYFVNYQPQAQPPEPSMKWIDQQQISGTQNINCHCAVEDATS